MEQLKYRFGQARLNWELEKLATPNLSELLFEYRITLNELIRRKLEKQCKKVVEIILIDILYLKNKHPLFEQSQDNIQMIINLSNNWGKIKEKERKRKYAPRKRKNGTN